jgi:N-acetylmuramoyl-L-alanine amidase
MATHDVAIDAGHGGFGVTPGKRTPDGEYEWNFNNKVAVACTNKLQANGIRVLRTDDPTGHTDVPLKTRTDKANAAGVKCFVSFHHNANTGNWGTWTGTEIFTYLGSHPGSERLANAILSRVLGAYGLFNRGAKRADFHVVRETHMDAVLLEGGYMDSTIDIKKLRDDNVLKAAGEAAADGIMAYLGVTPKPQPQPAPPQPTPVTEMYRVRKSWADAASQVGAFKDKQNAIDEAKKHAGYEVFDSHGNVVWAPSQPTPAPSPPQPTPPAPKYDLPNVVLRRGSTGTAVKQVQAALNQLHFNCGTPDGSYGPKTEDAVHRFQSVYCNPADGVYGPKTRAAMLAQLNK